MYIVLIVALVAVILKAVSYYFALCGVLYYLATKYNDELSVDRIKDLALKAMKQK